MAGQLQGGAKRRGRELPELGGRSEYAGSDNNGVSSRNYGEWEGSYRLDKTSIQPTTVEKSTATERTQATEKEHGYSAREESTAPPDGTGPGTGNATTASPG